MSLKNQKRIPDQSTVHRAQPFASLGYEKYRRLWTGTFFTFAAGQMTLVAKPWLAYEITGSAFWLGVVALSQGLPMLFMAPLGGVAADRFPKRTVLLLSQTALMLMAAIIAVVLYLDLIEVWHLILLSLVHGTAMPFNMPVRQSYIPILLPKKLISNGVALHASGRNMNQTIAPSLVGVLLGIDPLVAFIAIVVLHALSMLVLFGLTLANSSNHGNIGLIGDLKYGFNYVWSDKFLRLLFATLLLFLVFGMPYMHLLPVFQEILEVGPELLGFMYGAMGLGGFFGSITVASFRRFSTRTPQLIFGALFSLSLIGFALSPLYSLSLFLLFFSGYFHTGYTTINQTLILTRSDPSVHGRVISMNMMLRSSITIVVLPMGLLVDQFGGPSTLATSGTVLLFCFAGILLFTRKNSED